MIQVVVKYTRNPILLIFVLSFLVRVIKIQDYLFFGFEQGRDLQIIQQIYQLSDFVLVGPSTSIAGLFHGPWYYYLLALPLGLTAGNPLAASLSLITLGSFLPVVMYLLAKEVFNSKFWGLVSGILTIFSYEYILYSRWLSNVSLAPLSSALAFLFLWKYIKSRNSKYFLGFILCTGIASLFQMILLVQFIFLIVLLLVLKQLKIPSIKTSFLSIVILALLFSPMILFNFRNENITFNSLLAFGGGRADRGVDSFLSNISAYLIQMRSHLTLSLININSLLIQSLVIVGIGLGIGVFIKKHGDWKVVIFLLAWILMSLPIIIISPGNPQYYAAIGLGWILLFCLVLKIFWESQKLKSISLVFISLFLLGTVSTIKNLSLNEDVFFRTSQDDLNLKDQRSILEFINLDSGKRPYQLLAFTIPSLQPEGWQYLHRYYYPENQYSEPGIIYIVIEENVYDIWEKKWIDELGQTRLSWEKKFGKLRLQRRTLEADKI